MTSWARDCAFTPDRWIDLPWMRKDTSAYDYLGYDFRRLFVNGFGPQNTGQVLRVIEYRLESDLTGASYRSMCNDGTLLKLRQLRNWVLHIIKMHEEDGYMPVFVYSIFSDHSGLRAFGTAVLPKQVWESDQYAGKNPQRLKPERILPSKAVCCRVPREAEDMQRIADALDEIIDLIVEIGEARQEEEA